MQKEKRGIVFDIICIVFIAFIILCSFFFKSQIEQYATTGYFGLFLACFASTATILLPAPGILVVLRYAMFLNPILVVLLGGLGTALGELLGYCLGRSGQRIININVDNKFLVFVKKRNVLAIFLFSLLPLPFFDIVGISSGINRINPILFFVLCFLGKTVKLGLYVIAFKYLIIEV